MAKTSMLCSLDLGTSNTRVIVGEIDREGAVNIIGIGQSKSTGMKKGIIIDIEAAVNSIEDAVSQAERMIGEDIDTVVLGIGGPQTTLLRNSGVVAVQGEDKEITPQDVTRVVQAAQVLAIPPEREIISVNPISYIVDGYEGIKDPVGMIGVRLEVDALVVTGKATYLQNVRRCVEKADLEISDVVLKGIAGGNMALSSDERELGCALIDIGAGVTEISLYKHNTIQSFTSIPQGGDLITYDLAHGLRVPYSQAEQIKLLYGAASYEAAGQEAISYDSVGASESTQIDATRLVEYIKPRVEEMFDFIRNELIKSGFREPPSGGIVLTGGTCQLPGLLEVAERKLGTNVRIYRPEHIGVSDPSFTSSTAVLYYAAGHKKIKFHGSGKDSRTQRKPGKFMSKFRSLFTELFGG